MPRYHHCRDSSAARAEDGSLPRVARQVYAPAIGGAEPFNCREEVDGYEARKAVVGHIKFIAPIVSNHLAIGSANHSRLEKHSDGYRHLARGDERIEYRRGVAQHAVEPEIERRRACAVIAVGDIDMIAMRHRRIDTATVEHEVFEHNVLCCSGYHSRCGEQQ